MKNTIKSSKSSKTLFTRGFTLIEMLVVIAIIAILSGIIIANLSGAKGKARDAKRVSDLGNIQMALELYFDRCNQYPASVSNVMNFDDNSCPKQNSNASRPYKMIDFIASLPTPTNEKGQTNYKYITNTPSSGGPTDYVLHAVLESPNAAVLDGLNAPALDPSCSNTASSVNYCIGPK